MSQPIQTVAGIDVGGKKKGFHAVVLRGKTFEDKKTANDPAAIVSWCLEHTEPRLSQLTRPASGVKRASRVWLNGR